MLNLPPLSKTCFLKMVTFYFCQPLYCVWLHVELPWKLEVVVEFDCTFPVRNNEHTIRYISTNNEHTIGYLSTNNEHTIRYISTNNEHTIGYLSTNNEHTIRYLQ